MKKNVFARFTCFILVLFMLSTLCLSASAAGLGTIKTLSPMYNSEENLLTVKGTYDGIIQSERAYMVTLVDAGGKMISIKTPLGSELDKGNGVIEYSFSLDSSALGTYTMPMKLTVSCTTAGVLDAMTAEVSEGFEPSLLGDVNSDVSVDNLDASLILQYDAGLIDLNAPKEISDVNNDGVTDNVDASLILKYDAGLIDKL